jgi:hypothetical protein
VRERTTISLSTISWALCALRPAGKSTSLRGGALRCKSECGITAWGAAMTHHPPKIKMLQTVTLTLSEGPGGCTSCSNCCRDADAIAGRVVSAAVAGVAAWLFAALSSVGMTDGWASTSNWLPAAPTAMRVPSTFSFTCGHYYAGAKPGTSVDPR